jgi:single-strand DNA-binding protein
MNKAQIMGYLGKVPELRHGTSGDAVTTLSVADTDRWTSNGETHEHTEWHDCVLWGKQAESAVKYLTKGSFVYVEGKMNTRTWKDKDGNNRTTHEIRVTSLRYLDRKPKEASATQAELPEGARPSEE